MSRKLIVAMAVLSVAFMGTVFAAVESIKVSGDVNSEYISRDFALGEVSNAENDSETFISQIRLRFDADLTEGVSAVLQLLSERGWGEDNSADINDADDIEVNLGYVELKEFFYEPLTLIIGKQNLKLGNGLVVGNPDTNQGMMTASSVPTGLPTMAEDLSLNKAFDAIRAVLDFSPWTVNLLLAQVDEVATGDRRDDEILLGINAAYDWNSYNGVSEVYIISANSQPQSTDVTDTKDHVYTFGTRTQLDVNDNLSAGLEIAYQIGDRYVSATDHDNIGAWAIQLGSEYSFLNDYNAKIGLGYTFLTGDESKSEQRYEGWDPLWEDQTPAEIINILMENTDAHILTVSGSMMPREDLTLGILYAHASRDKKDLDGTYSPSLGAASGYTYSVSQNDQDFGDEIDAYAIYDYTEDVQLKLSGAWFLPGKYFMAGNNNPAYSVRTGVVVDF